MAGEVGAGMFQDTQDVVKTAALLLAIVLPIVAMIYQNRKENKKEALPPTIGAGGMSAIGGALASQEASRLYVEEFQRVTEAVDRLADAMHTLSRAQSRDADRASKFLDEMIEVRRIWDRIAHHLSRQSPQ